MQNSFKTKYSTDLEQDTASSIAEALLKRTGDALISGDFDAFVPWFTMPFTLETFSGKRVVDTDADFLEIFNSVFRTYQKFGVTRLERRVIEAEMQSDDLIWSTHESRGMYGTQIMHDSSVVFTIIKRVAGVWLIADCQYAVSNTSLDQAYAQSLVPTKKQLLES
ncbi:MAG: hypothetical protein ABJL99_08050 [Aliishimia sp.]